MFVLALRNLESIIQEKAAPKAPPVRAIRPDYATAA
jgi:hypothetical protein